MQARMRMRVLLVVARRQRHERQSGGCRAEMAACFGGASPPLKVAASREAGPHDAGGAAHYTRMGRRGV